MVSEVTDPKILAQLEGDSGGREVTDPNILKQLEAPEKPQESMLQSILKQPLQGSSNLVEGLMQSMISGKASSPLGATSEAVKNVLANQLRNNPVLAFALPEANLGKVGTIIEQIPKIGKYLKSGIGQAIPQAAYAAASEADQSPEEMAKSAGEAGAFVAPFGAAGKMVAEGNPITRALGRLALGGGAGLMGHEVAKASGVPYADVPMTLLAGYLGSRGINPERAAQRKLLQGIDVTPEVQERVNAAKRLNLDYITPAEATLSPFEAAKQGQIGKTSAGAKLLYEKGGKRIDSEEEAINHLFDEIYDGKKLSGDKKAAYENAMQSKVPQNFIDRYSQDPIVEKAMNYVENKPEYKRSLRGVPKDSFEYWDKVKRIIGDMEESAKRGSKPGKFSQSQFADARQKMVGEMDKINPTYETARNIAERDFTRQTLENVFDKKDVNANNFFGFLKSNKKFNDIYNRLDAFPKAQQKLKDMRLLFGDLISQDPSIRSVAKGKRQHYIDPREMMESLSQYVNELTGKKHDVAMVNLMTDPDWISKVSQVKAPMQREELIGALLKNIGKGGGQYISRGDE